MSAIHGQCVFVKSDEAGGDMGRVKMLTREMLRADGIRFESWSIAQKISQKFRGEDGIIGKHYPEMVTMKKFRHVEGGGDGARNA